MAENNDTIQFVCVTGDPKVFRPTKISTAFYKHLRQKRKGQGSRQDITQTKIISKKWLIQDLAQTLNITLDRHSERILYQQRMNGDAVRYWIEKAAHRAPNANVDVISRAPSFDKGDQVVFLAGMDGPEVSSILDVGGMIVWVGPSVPPHWMVRDDRVVSVTVLSATYNGFVIGNIVKAIESCLETSTPVQLSRALSIITSSPSRSRHPVDWSDDENRLAELIKINFFTTYLGKHQKRALLGRSSMFNVGTNLSTLTKFLYQPTLRDNTANQTSQRLSSVFLIENPSRAWDQFRNTFSASNLEEEYFETLHKNDFMDLHTRAHIQWETEKDKELAEITNILENIAVNDKLQFNKKASRSLKMLRRDGIEFGIDPSASKELEKFIDNEIVARRPILEFVKNERIFRVANFSESKSSLVVHDLIDHLWVYSFLDLEGLFDLYADMFRAIGDPHLFDINRREGEIVASLSYSIRAFKGIPAGFRSCIFTRDILERFREKGQELTDVHMDALKIAYNMEEDGPEWRSLGYTFSSYVAELNEQRRKHGAIKYKDHKSGVIVSELDVYSVDFLGFFIHAHHLIFNKAKRYRTAIFVAHFEIERCLRNSLDPSNHYPTYKLKVGDLSGGTINYDPIVPEEVCYWMFENYGFCTNREELS